MIKTPAPNGLPRGRNVEHWQETWSSVLARHVDARGQVDFAGLAEDRGGLDEVVRFIAAIDPVSSPAQFPTSNARLAYYIDAYNALAMHGVLEFELAWRPPMDGNRPRALASADVRDAVRAECLSTTDCYLAQKAHGEIIIGSTTEEVGFDASVTASAMKTLTAGAIRAVPFLAGVRVKRVWAGLRPGTPDELPRSGAGRRTRWLLQCLRSLPDWHLDLAADGAPPRGGDCRRAPDVIPDRAVSPLPVRAGSAGD